MRRNEPAAMANYPPTIDDLRRATAITDAEIDEACGAYVADQHAAPFRFGSGHTLDVAAAVAAYGPAKAFIAGANPSIAYKRWVVRLAILRARSTTP